VHIRHQSSSETTSHTLAKAIKLMLLLASQCDWYWASMNTSNSVCVCLMPSVNNRHKAREDLVNYSRCVCVCVCGKELSHSPVAVSQTVTVLSKEPMSIRSPVVLKFTQITSAEWPCTFRHNVVIFYLPPLSPLFPHSLPPHSLPLLSLESPLTDSPPTPSTFPHTLIHLPLYPCPPPPTPSPPPPTPSSTSPYTLIHLPLHPRPPSPTLSSTSPYTLVHLPYTLVHLPLHTPVHLPLYPRPPPIPSCTSPYTPYTLIHLPLYRRSPPPIPSSTHRECALFCPSLHTPEFGSGVHAAGGHQGTGGIESQTHNLPCMPTERVVTFASLCAP